MSNIEKPSSSFDRNQLLQLISDSIYDGLIVIDKDYNIIHANSHFASIYNKTVDDFIGKKCTDLIGFDHCHHSCPHHDIMNRKADFSEHGLYCRKCLTGPYCVSASPLLDNNGEVIGIVEIYRDMKKLGMYIGNLEETNAALMLEKEKLHKILDDIADGYYTATPEGRIISVNSKLVKLLGKSAQDMIGYRCSDVLCGPDCAADCPREWAVKNKKNVINSHQQLKLENHKIPYDKSIIIVQDKDGKVESVIGVINRVSEILDLKENAENALVYFDIITKNKTMHDMINLVREAAPTDAPILITGETGTGKELVARAIQELSNRKNKPFVKINCSALTESLLESELFGHAKGAFTGAVANYAGKFKKADGGTILLDELEEMSPALQAKLLRLIEEQEFEPVGSNRLEKVDVRIIAATNVELSTLIAAGRFRSDLYYRLNVIRIAVPPLRDRHEDIPVLIDHRLNFLGKKYHKDINSVSTRAMDLMARYDWPGNIRQLFGALEFAYLRCKSDRIERTDLPEEIFQAANLSTKSEKPSRKDQRQEIEKLLKLYPNNRQRVAFELGISRTTLWRKMQDLGLQLNDYNN